MRLFTALNLPGDVHAELRRVQAELRGHMRSRRWQNLSQAHLTVHFLGEVPDESLEPLQAMLEAGCAQAAPFELELGGLGGFPSLRRPRVLWLGVVGDRPQLLDLEQHLREGITTMGLPLDDRAYSPHITLAREPEWSPAMADLPERLAVKPLRWRVEGLTLFHSDLSAGTAMHTALGNYPLLGGG